MPFDASFWAILAILLHHNILVENFISSNLKITDYNGLTDD
jgi:hypothetical protein